MSDRCIADIEPDADVGGYGAMASFLVIAWMTMGFSAYDAWASWRVARGVSTSRLAPNAGPDEEPNPPNKTVKEILVRLIDLQTITGTGISIAGITQIIFYSPTYYHCQLINSYWWLTMQSFWVVPQDFLNLVSLSEEEGTSLTSAPIIRLLTVLVTTILGTFFQVYIMVKENEWGEWSYVSGPCYRWWYSIWEWTGTIFTGMTGTYALFLALIIIPWTREWALGRDEGVRYIQGVLKDWWLEGWNELCGVRRTDSAIPDTLGTELTDYVDIRSRTPDSIVETHSAPPPPQITIMEHETRTTPVGNEFGSRTLFSGQLLHILQVLFASIAVVIFWLFVQFLALCAYGDGFYPFVFAACAGFNAWTTVDIISLRVVNEPLLQDDEKKMGFGQVLPLVLVLSVFMPSLAAAGTKSRSKTWEGRRR